MSNLLAFIVLFGVLVFFHELGHFLVAKYFKVGVEKFSLGYGPKIFGKKIGETEYIISALPLGGYVKMVGDEPTDELDAERDLGSLPANSFLVKPPLQRIAIVLMGPIANLILPIVLFFVLYMVGQPHLTSQVGFVKPASPAAQAGIRPGDRIVNVNGEAIDGWSVLLKTIQKNTTDTLQVDVVRGAETRKITVHPTMTESLNPFGEPVEVPMIGVQPQSFEPVVYVPLEESIAYRAGLRSGDRLIAVGGDGERLPIAFRWQLVDTIGSGSTEQLQIVVDRDGAEQTINLYRSELVDSRGEVALNLAGIYFSEMVVDKVQPDSVAQEKGIQPKDILFAINGEEIHHWFVFQEKIRNSSEGPLTLTVIRDGQPTDLDVQPRMVEQKQELTGEKVRQRILGVMSLGTFAKSNVEIRRVLNPIKAFAMSFARCYEIVRLTVIGFGKLVTGKVSSKSLGGPILIYQLAGKSWESGFYAFINMIVLISITLGILNLLPIPVLDGGHLMFYTIELIQGRPVKARTRDWLQRVGIIFLLGLMIFAFYNDLGRISWGEVGWVNWLRNIFS